MGSKCDCCQIFIDSDCSSGKTVSNMLKLLSIDLCSEFAKQDGTDSADQFAICNDCMKKLESAFNFKSKCLCTERYITDYIDSKTDANKIDLKMVYLKEKHCDGQTIDENMTACRLCMELCYSSSMVSLEELLVDDCLQKIFKNNFPEITLTATESPVICESCFLFLQIFSDFMFLTTCSKIEENKDGLVKPEPVIFLDKMFKEGNYSDDTVFKNGFHFVKVEEENITESCDDLRDNLELEVDVLVNSEENNNSVKREDDIKFKVAEDHSYESLPSMKNVKQDENHCLDAEAPEHSSYSSASSKIFSERVYEQSTPEFRKVGQTENRAQTMNKSKTHLKQSKLKKKRPPKGRTYSCEICFFESKYGFSLARHMLVHKNASELIMHRCDVCSFESKYKRCLKRHVLIHKNYSDVKTYRCEICPYETKFKEHLTQHTLVHKSTAEVVMYKCEICSYETKHKNTLNRHSLVHKNPFQLKMYKCEYCSHESKHKELFKRHMLVHKNVSELTTFKCKRCSFETKDRVSLRNHITSDHNANPSIVTMHKCDMCPYQTNSRYKLMKHMVVHNKPLHMQMHRCASCAFETNSAYKLTKHLAVHNKSEERIHRCEICSYETKLKSCLRQHTLIHANVSAFGTYECANCSYITRCKNLLKRHVLVHARPSTVRMYKCGHCSFKTKYNNNLKRHEMTHKTPLQSV